MYLYARCNHPDSALKVYDLMKEIGLTPDEVGVWVCGCVGV
jgi:pentatricopeptide repeat protein